MKRIIQSIDENLIWTEQYRSKDVEKVSRVDWDHRLNSENK